MAAEDPSSITFSDPFSNVARRVVEGGRLVRSWPLEGGVSAIMHALEIQKPDGQARRVVVRQPGAAHWKPQANDLAVTEFALLEALHRLGMKVPQVYLLDESCKVLPTPYLVMELVEGTTSVTEAELPEALRQMATFLAQLHSLEIEADDLPDLPDLEDPVENLWQYLPTNELTERLRAGLVNGSRWHSTNPQSLLHGDFWPGNLLWHNGELAAVLDWEDASLGDPLSDLACCRVEVLCKYGPSAMESFTAQYCALSKVDVGNLTLWDLYVSAAAAATMSEWGLAPEEEADRRSKTVGFMERAAEELLSRSN